MWCNSAHVPAGHTFTHDIRLSFSTLPRFAVSCDELERKLNFWSYFPFFDLLCDWELMKHISWSPAVFNLRHRDTLSWFLGVITCPQPFSSVTLTIKVWPPERGAKQLVHQLWWLQSIYFKWESPKFCWWHSHSKIYTQIKFHENTANNNIGLQLRSKLLAPFIKLSKTRSFSHEMTKTKKVFIL